MRTEKEIFSLYPDHEIEQTFNFSNYPLKDIHLISTKNVKNYSGLDRIFPNHFVCSYILNGSGILKINNDSIPFSSNSTIFVKKGIDFSIISNIDSLIEKVDIIFSANYIENMLAEYSIHSGVYNIDTINNFVTLQELTNNSFDENCSLLFSENIHQILMKISSHLRFNPNTLALKIKLALDSHLYKQCNIIEIANDIHISKDTLNRIFKKYYNRTPYDYLLSKKIDIAKKLLLTTNYTVQYISHSLSYYNERYFSDLFTNKVGLSPTEYRKKFSNTQN